MARRQRQRDGGQLREQQRWREREVDLLAVERAQQLGKAGGGLRRSQGQYLRGVERRTLLQPILPAVREDLVRIFCID